MKKLLTILLAAGMFAMYSCGGGSDQSGTSGDTTTVAPEAPAPPPAAPDTTMPADTVAH